MDEFVYCLHYLIGIIIIKMQQKDGHSSPTSNSKSSSQSSPHKILKTLDEFRIQFFSMIRKQQSPASIQKYLISSRRILSDKIILHMYSIEPKLYQQFRYLILALSLSFEKKEQFHQRWGTFYQIINEILKMPNQARKNTRIESHVLHFTYFLLDHHFTFFDDFPNAKNLVATFQSQNSKNQQQNNISVKKIVRIFNSLLCLKFIDIDDLLLLVYNFGLKSQNYSQFLQNVQEKFIKRMIQYQSSNQEDSQNHQSGAILSISKIYIILHLFYDLDPQNKLRQLLKKELADDQPNSFKLDRYMIVFAKILSKTHKNKPIRFQKLLKYIIKEILKNKTITVKYKKQFILQCFSQIRDIDQQFFESLLEAQSSEQNQQISQILIKFIERQSLNSISVSRLRSILKRISLSKNLSYSKNMVKIFRILRLVYWIAKKFNQPHPTYQLQPNSSIKIQNIRKAMMIIFSIDFSRPHTGRVINFEIHKTFYSVIMKYSEVNDACLVQILVEVEGVQKLKQKKQINKWSYILCMIGLQSKKQLSIVIDGALFKINMENSGTQITSIQFGPFLGSIKDVYILDKIYEMCQMHKKYFQSFRKMDVLLDELGQKNFIFTFDRGKVAEKTNWFWRKQMVLDYKNVNKLRSISFGEGVEQLGGFPALLYLATRVIPQQKSDDLVSFLIDFFQFFKLMLNQSSIKQVEKWMLASTSYFGQFLWLILSKNQHLRKMKKLFNRIFDFFDWFHNLSLSYASSQALKLAIIQDIYLNFQIWSQCSLQIKLMLFAQVQKRLQNPSVLLKIRNKQGYEKIMSSIVFFFLQQNDQQNSDVQYFLGIPIFFVHIRISTIGSKFCQLYLNEKQQYDVQTIQKDMNTIMSLINTFFYKKHLYFSKGEISALAILLDHYDKNFRKLIIQDRLLEYHTQIISQISTLISLCPSQCEAIFMLFQLGVGLTMQIQCLKGGAATIIDAFTLKGQRAADTLQFAFRATIFIIRNSKNIYQPNSVFDEQQIMSVLLGSLRIKAHQNKEQLNYSNFTNQFINYPLPKLKKLIALTQFCMIIQECIEHQDLFPTAVFFLKFIINNTNLLPEGSKLATNCIKIINSYLKQMRYEQKTLHSQSLQTKEIQFNVSQIKQLQDQIDDSKIQLQKQKTQNQQKLQKQQVLQKQQQQTIEKAFSTEQVKQLATQCDKQTIVILKQSFQYNDLEILFKYCKCSQLLQVLLKLNIFSLPITKFDIPIKSQLWETDNKNYGGDLAIIFKQSNFSVPQLSLLGKFVQQQNLIRNNLAEIEKRSETGSSIKLKFVIKDVVYTVLPLFIIYHVISKIVTSAPEFSKKQVTDFKQLYKFLFDNLKLQQIIYVYHSIKNHKNTLLSMIKIEQSNSQKRKTQIINISHKIVQDCQKKTNQDKTFQIQINQLRIQFEKQKWETKYLIDNQKSVKILLQKIKDVLGMFHLLIQCFSKNSIEMLEKEICPSILRKKTESYTKKKKYIQAPDEKEKQKYDKYLKYLIQQLSSRMQNQSKKKQQMWKNLAQKNKFWSSSKIKNNQCYEIHPKITGYYRLNIVKTAFEEVPYPRRKSFQHQIEQQNTGQPEILNKQLGILSNSKSLFVPQLILSSQETKLKKQEIIKTPKKQVQLPKQYFVVQYVTQKGIYAGILIYDDTENCFIFKSRGYDSLPKDNKVYQNSTIFHRIQDKSFRIKIQLNLKSQIFARRYIHRHTAIELFSFHQSYFFNLFFKDIRDKFFKIYSSKMTCISDVRVQFEKRKYTQRWLQGKLDNFQYLMLINIFSGRTYNDLAQYPIVPWVLTNFQLKETQLNKQFFKDENNIRDLTKPAGKLNSKKFQNMKMRCNQIQDDDYESKFLYGTIYSNPTVIYNFFIRLEPFTTLHWQHQGRRIDHADRLFSTVVGQLNTVMTSSSDNKQLIPEFYYWPQFLKNRNKVNLGTKQNKQQVDDVKLPGWARNPEQFIFKMRQILQSGEVSKHIHAWIDLIFGYQNPRDVALQYDNLYHYRTYQHDIFETQETEQGIKGAQITISQFGQIPFPLFLKPHPQRLLIYSQNLKLDTSAIIKKLGNKKILQMMLNQQGFFIAYENQVEFYQIENTKFLDTTLQKPYKSFPSLGTSVKLFDLTNNIWLSLKQGIFRIYDKKVCAYQNDAEMQCFTFYGRYVVFGYRSQLIVAKIQNNLKLTKVNSFYGHKNNICNIQVNITLDIVISIDRDGLVLIHEFEKQKFMRQFDLGTKSQITNICIHEMGYFIFLTKDQKLIIYTFLGELFLNQDIGISNRAISEQITKIKIFQQNRSLLLISTDKAKIYMVDFLQIKRFNQNCMYKQFSRFKINILQNCPRIGATMAIKDFFVKSVPGEGVITYKVYALYENNSIIYYYSAQQFQQKLKKNKLFNPLGLFDSQKTKDTQKSTVKQKSQQQGKL